MHWLPVQRRVAKLVCNTLHDRSPPYLSDGCQLDESQYSVLIAAVCLSVSYSCIHCCQSSGVQHVASFVDKRLVDDYSIRALAPVKCTFVLLAAARSYYLFFALCIIFLLTYLVTYLLRRNSNSGKEL